MATRKKNTADGQQQDTPVVNNRKRYVVIEPLKGQINKQVFAGNIGDIIEMEPWQAKLLRTYVKEE